VGGGRPSSKNKAEADPTLTMEMSNVEVPADMAFSRKMLHKVDLHILPILAVLYSFTAIDCINLLSAYV
jgi:hypothetical protein